VSGLARIEVNRGNDVGVEEALPRFISIRRGNTGKRTYPFIDPGITAKQEVYPDDIPGCEPDNDVQSVRACSEL